MLGRVAVHVLLLVSFIVPFGNTSNTIWFNPNVAITQFQVTMLVPALSRGVGAHGVWPGLQNTDDTFVFQSVISDTRVPGQWNFFVEYCCNPDYQAGSTRVYPGDSITSVFSVGAEAVWTDSWTLKPGASGLAAGQTAQSGSTGNSFAKRGTINKAVLSIELQNNGTWDFGQVQWTSLSITASTTTSWCTGSYVTSGGFKYSVSGGTSHISGSSSTCVYNSVTFG